MLLWDLLGKFPGSDYESFNYDWIIGKLKELKDSAAAALASEEAAAESAEDAAHSASLSAGFMTMARRHADTASEKASEAAESAESIEGVVDQVNANTSRIDSLIAHAGDDSGNSELLDIRIGYNGVTYATAGDAVRDQIENLVDNKVSKFGYREVTELNTTFFTPGNNRLDPAQFIDGKSIDGNGDIVDGSGYTLSGYCYVGDAAVAEILRYANNIVFAQNMYIMGYDQDGNKVGSRVFGNSITISNTQIKFIRIAYNTNLINQIMVYVGDDQPTTFIPYSFTFNYAEPDEVDTIKVGPNEEHTSLLEALKHTTSNLIVEPGIYNVVDEYIDEYGSDFWENYQGYSNSTDPFMRGLWVKNRKVTLSPNTVILYDYDGNNQIVGPEFSVMATSKDAEIEGGIIKVINGTGLNYAKVRYMIHDDFDGGLTGDNKFKNIIFDGNVRSSAPIGGGCGRQNRYNIEGCVFLNNLRPYDISYHNNSSNGKCFIEVSGCYGNRVCAFRWYGTGTDITTCIAHDNHFANIECVAHTSEPSDIENMALYEWNNILTQ